MRRFIHSHGGLLRIPPARALVTRHRRERVKVLMRRAAPLGVALAQGGDAGVCRVQSSRARHGLRGSGSWWRSDFGAALVLIIDEPALVRWHGGM